MSVLGRPSDVDLDWLKAEDRSAYDGVMASLGGGIGAWFGGVAAAAAAPAPTLQAILPDAPAEGLELLRAMFALRPDQRCSARQAMERPFFKELLEGPAAEEYKREFEASHAAAAAVGEPPELHTANFNNLSALTDDMMRAMMAEEVGKWRAALP